MVRRSRSIGSSNSAVASPACGAAARRGHQRCLATAHLIMQDDLEDLPELSADRIQERLTELGAGLAGIGLDGGDVVLSDVDPACELALGDAGSLSRRLQARRPNLDPQRHRREHTRSRVDLALRSTACS